MKFGIVSCAANLSIAADSWTVTTPAANTEYYYQSVPIDVTYDWDTGTKAYSIDYKVYRTANPGTEIGHTNQNALSTSPTTHSLKLTETCSITRLPTNGEGYYIIFTARTVTGGEIATKRVDFTVRQTQDP